MKKLTDEQVDSVVEKFAGGAEWTDTDYINAVTFARAIEAEVLRLNGITDDPRKTVFVRARAANNKWLSWEIVEPTDPNAVRAALICYEATGTPIGDLVDVLDEKPSERVYKSADELFESLGIDTKPRATGCPDTMDETAEIAVALKQAGEEKSPPATGPAG